MERIRGTMRALPVLALLGAAPMGASATPVISELLYDVPGTDNGVVFVELYGTPGSSLDGLVLEAVNGSNGDVYLSAALSGAFPDDGLFVLADDAGDGTTSVTQADQIAQFDPQNGPDSIVLRDADGVLDALGYGVFGSGDVFAGEGSPALAAAAGQSLMRPFANLDTDDNFGDFVVNETPNPGSAQVAAVPIPGTLILLASGAAGLLSRMRPRGSPA